MYQALFFFPLEPKKQKKKRKKKTPDLRLSYCAHNLRADCRFWLVRVVWDGVTMRYPRRHVVVCL